jgi:hypothetical protein
MCNTVVFCNISWKVLGMSLCPQLTIRCQDDGEANSRPRTEEQEFTRPKLYAKVYAQSIPCGLFTVIENTQLNAGRSIKSRCTRELKKKVVVRVEVVEHIRDEHRVRGRTEEGDWITIRCTDNGMVFATPKR